MLPAGTPSWHFLQTPASVQPPPEVPPTLCSGVSFHSPGDGGGGGSHVASITAPHPCGLAVGLPSYVLGSAVSTRPSGQH